MRVLKALAALTLLVVLLVGVPALLLAWGRPSALVDVQWSSALLRPDDGVILLGVLSVAGWLAWATVAVTLLTEVLAHLSHQRLRIRLPGTGWLQPLLGTLVAMALAPAMTVHAEEPSPPVSTHAAVGAENSATAGRDAAVEQTPPTRDYVVQRGDELWGVAEDQLGSGAAWRDILRCNPGMTADQQLVPGTTIHLPAVHPATQPPVAAPGAPNTQHHITVQRGDTLWDLSEEHLGDAHRWPELFAANRDVIADPDEIDIGWRLAIPPPIEPSTSAAPNPEPPKPEPEPPKPEPPHPRIPASAHPTAPTTEAPDPPEITPRPSAQPTTTSPTALPNTPGHGRGEPAGQQAATDSETVLELLGPVGGVLAASLVAGVAARRHAQLLQRGVGRRISALAPPLQRFFTALVRRSDTGPGGPDGTPATAVIIGWDDSGDIHVDVEEQRCTLIRGADEHTAGMAATAVTSLLCAQWSSAVDVVAVQPHDDWSSALDDPRLTSHAAVDAALAELQRTCASRRLELGHADLATVRADPDRAAAWAPTVYVFCQPLLPRHVDHVHDALALGRVGVSVIAAARTTSMTDFPAVIDIESDTTARLGGHGDAFQPQLLNRPARRAVVSLFASALDGRTEPAPWWRDGDPAEVTDLPDTAEEPIKDDAMPAWSRTPDHPTLLVLGPVELTGATGERPTRAVGQCMEYCAWLLLNPGSTPTAMVRDLLVAEGTRRSNMSRLRTWLGSDAAGHPHLPDAYSGRIALAPAVTSDWERFQSLLAGGVNRSSTPLLQQALSLVRGRPLDGVAFQWPWASGWLTEMLGMITDAAVVLADRCITSHDLDGALWAIGQGQLATGDDETLAVRRIQVLARMGEQAEVDAAVTRVTRAARVGNRDLAPESIQRIQHALHLTTSHPAGSRNPVDHTVSPPVMRYE